jgi:hypothetical protein
MLITQFLNDQAFDPETVEAMEEAFATTCEALKLTDRADAMTQIVSEKIFELARNAFRRDKGNSSPILIAGPINPSNPGDDPNGSSRPLPQRGQRDQPQTRPIR